MNCTTWRKRAGERLDWLVDYADFLDGDTLAAAEIPLIDGLNVETTIEGSGVRVWIAGGVAGTAYKLPLKITSAQGRMHTDCLKLRVR